jgi:UDP-2,3-diacylglucosamine pyrophosphatase LpxH
MKKLLLILFSLAMIFFVGFISWALSSHGTIGLLKITPISMYVLVLIVILGITFIGLFLLYWRLDRRHKGSQGNRLSFFLIAVSIIFIVAFSSLFLLLGGFPSSKGIEPISKLGFPDTDGQNLHFAVGSDTQFGAGTNSPSQTMAMLDQIKDTANKFDIFFFLGDLVEYGYKDDFWAEASNAFYPAAASVPICFAPGNHDTLFGGLSRYMEHCCSSNTGSSNSSSLWYRVDIGRVHFLVLDVEWSVETFTKDQKNWLETQLDSIPMGDWKIVMSHGFYYSSGTTSLGWNCYDNAEVISALVPLFERYDVDIVFSGHNHYLEFLQHAGVNYVVSGGFGGKLDPTPTYISPCSLWLSPGQFGFVDVTISDDRATLVFRDPYSNELKSFSIFKH